MDLVFVSKGVSVKKRDFLHYVILAVLVLTLFTLTINLACGGGNGQNDQSLTIKGSDTMVHLVSTWAEDYMNKHEGVQISVTGGGSGTGIAALINGTTEICAASRSMKPNELELATKQGKEPVEYDVALDGIAVVVHPDNPVDQLTLNQLKQIFTGESDNWQEFGGPDEKIYVLSRESSSGTYVFFNEHVLQSQDYSKQARLMPATSAIIQSISEDKWSIGYVGLGYAHEAGEKVKMIAVKNNPEEEAILPSPETVKDGSYSIARPLHFYTIGQPQGLTKEFIDYCLSSEGQETVVETGYVSVN
jgi:phosphate transport system substrate-binding protein